MSHSAEVQRRLKTERVAEAFEAVAIEHPAVNWVSGPDRDYRNRVRLRIDGGRVEFFNAEKSLDCAVLEPGLREAIVELRAVAVAESCSHFAWVEVRGVDAHGRVSACFAPREALPGNGAVPPELAAARESLQSRLGSHFLVGVLGEARPPVQGYRSVGVEVVVAAGAFLQVNHQVNAALVEQVLSHAERAGASEFLDLYAGCGNFALPLAARGLVGAAVESSAASVASLREGVKRSGLDQLEVVHDDVLDALAGRSEPSAFVIADPPRAGLKGAVPHLARLCSSELLLVSCNPKSLARDVAQLSPHFRLQSLGAFDMFPHTEHLEVMAQLSRTATP